MYAAKVIRKQSYVLEFGIVYTVVECEEACCFGWVWREQKDGTEIYSKMFVSELYCCIVKRTVRTLTLKMQRLSGRSCVKNLGSVGFKVNPRDFLKSTWISARVIQFKYVVLNSTLLSTYSDEVLRNGTCSLLLENTSGHIPAVTKNYKRGIFSYFAWAVWKIWDFCLILFRVVQLTGVFIPLVVMYPLTLISMRLKSLWYKLLLFGKN